MVRTGSTVRVRQRALGGLALWGASRRVTVRRLKLVVLVDEPRRPDDAVKPGRIRFRAAEVIRLLGNEGPARLLVLAQPESEISHPRLTGRSRAA